VGGQDKMANGFNKFAVALGRALQRAPRDIKPLLAKKEFAEGRERVGFDIDALTSSLDKLPSTEEEIQLLVAEGRRPGLEPTEAGPPEARLLEPEAEQTTQQKRNRAVLEFQKSLLQNPSITTTQAKSITDQVQKILQIVPSEKLKIEEKKTERAQATIDARALLQKDKLAADLLKIDRRSLTKKQSQRLDARLKQLLQDSKATSSIELADFKAQAAQARLILKLDQAKKKLSADVFSKNVKALNDIISASANLSEIQDKTKGLFDFNFSEIFVGDEDAFDPELVQRALNTLIEESPLLAPKEKEPKKEKPKPLSLGAQFQESETKQKSLEQQVEAVKKMKGDIKILNPNLGDKELTRLAARAVREGKTAIQIINIGSL